jgi:hypothetical protein
MPTKSGSTCMCRAITDAALTSDHLFFTAHARHCHQQSNSMHTVVLLQESQESLATCSAGRLLTYDIHQSRDSQFACTAVGGINNTKAMMHRFRTHDISSFETISPTVCSTSQHNSTHTSQ